MHALWDIFALHENLAALEAQAVAKANGGAVSRVFREWELEYETCWSSANSVMTVEHDWFSVGRT